MKRKDYDQLIFEQRTPYLQWLKENEKNHISEPYTGKLFCTLPFSSCEDKVSDCLLQCDWNAPTQPEWLIFSRKTGMLHPDAYYALENAIRENPEADLFYCDEDYLGTLDELYGLPKGKGEILLYRGKPWFKPDFSPDTLEAFFYIGNCFIVRTAAWKKWISHLNFEESSIYDVILHAAKIEQACWKSCFCHISQVLFTNGYFKDEKELPGRREVGYALEKQPLVSIIIPTKDHIEVLERCLDTVLEKTIYQQYEILLVDNGSTKENSLWINQKISELTEKYGISIRYLYEEKDFNFSYMCNFGAEQAKGEVFLFLNNDMEIQDGVWLEKLLYKALQPHVGAVGAKLLFPEKSQDGYARIQHAGVANMAVGPMHKLCGMEDKGNLYHGRNLLNHNVLIVTGACLMIRKDVFQEAKGFDERFPVAYNDVELCIKLYEMGYYNVQRNDCALIHHESISRGKDSTGEQQKRLFEELELLYTLHPQFRTKDPFYSRHLVQNRRDVDFVCDYRYPYEKEQKVEMLPPKVGKKLPKENRSKLQKKLLGEHLLQVQVESMQYENRDLFRMDGWSIWQKKDNRIITKWLILQDKNHPERCYQILCEPKLREDVAQVFADRTMRLSGFQVMFSKREIPQGCYRLGMLMQAEAGKRKITKACWSDVEIEVKDDILCSR